MRKFTAIESKILNRVQKDWKITETPFADLSIDLGISESEIIDTVSRLKEEKIIRDISAVFSAEKLGYKSSLVAFKTPADTDNTAGIINSHQGVSHNYLRDNPYNIWFTIAVRGDQSIESEVKKLALKCGVTDYIILRTEKLLKIGLDLEIGSNGENDESQTAAVPDKEYHTGYRTLSETEKRSVCILQTDLPLCARPFKELTEKFNTGIDEKTLVLTGERLKKEGIMRRYSAVLKHSRAGYTSNAMTAWKTGSAGIDDKTAGIFMRSPAISHLYIRTVYPGRWEYPLFAMIHARSDEELSSIISGLSEKSGIKDYLVLRSLKEFKKKRVKYFAEEFGHL